MKVEDSWGWRVKDLLCKLNTNRPEGNRLDERVCSHGDKGSYS